MINLTNTITLVFWELISRETITDVTGSRWCTGSMNTNVWIFSAVSCTWKNNKLWRISIQMWQFKFKCRNPISIQLSKVLCFIVSKKDLNTAKCIKHTFCDHWNLHLYTNSCMYILYRGQPSCCKMYLWVSFKKAVHTADLKIGQSTLFQ